MNEFIDVAVVYYYKMHNAHALERAHEVEDVVLSDIDVNKLTKHIKNAVNITIYENNINKLVANTVIPKYFSRDVYNDIDWKLFDDFCFEKIASSSYGIVKSVSLGLTLVVA